MHMYLLWFISRIRTLIVPVALDVRLGMRVLVGSLSGCTMEKVRILLKGFMGTNVRTMLER